jgi:hypothetical protein
MPKRKTPAKRQEAGKRPRNSSDGKQKSAIARDQGPLREHLVALLRGGNAHVDFETAIADFPAELRGVKPAGSPFGAWSLLEHMRIAQRDILEFSRNPKHVSPAWPAEYWPEAETPLNAAAWKKSIDAFRADLRALQKLVAATDQDLFARIPHGDGQTLLREALLIADHNAYHLGQFVLLRRLLGAWDERS